METDYRHALIVGKFAPLHAGHQRMIETALSEADRLTILVYANPDFTAMPQAMRAGWLRALYPQADVLEPQSPPPDESTDDVHRQHVRDFLRDRGILVDVVYTCEDYGDGFAQVLGVSHRRLDGRLTGKGDNGVEIPVSATLIRSDPFRWRHLLHPVVYSHFIARIVLLGAESTGKSTLAAALGRHFATQSVAEYGREVWEAKGGKLALADYVDIAVGHRERETAAVAYCRDYLFVDTNALTTMFFSHYYNRDSLPELRRLADDCRGRYALVLVCDDDIAFEQDGWRDNEVWRGRMQGMVLHDLRVRGIDFHTVSGSLAKRISQVSTLLPPAPDLNLRA